MANTMTDWKKRREEYIDRVWKRGKYKVEEGREMTEKTHIKCPLCADKHKIDAYGWVETCEGYMNLSEFELLVKMETGENIKYA